MQHFRQWRRRRGVLPRNADDAGDASRSDVVPPLLPEDDEPLPALDALLPGSTTLPHVLPPDEAAVARTTTATLTSEALAQITELVDEALRRVLPPDADAVARSAHVFIDAATYERSIQPHQAAVARVRPPDATALDRASPPQMAALAHLAPPDPEALARIMASFGLEQNVFAQDDSDEAATIIILGDDIEELDASDPPIASFLNWLQAGSAWDERRYLETHTTIITIQVIDFMQRLLQQPTLSARTRWFVLERMRLFHDILNRNERDQNLPHAIHDAYVNWRGGFILDLPDWLVQVNAQDDHLREQGETNAALAARVALWRSAIERLRHEHHDEVIFAEAQCRLFSAHVAQLKTGAAAFEEATICLDEALQVYTRERFPICWAFCQNNLGVAAIERLDGDKAEQQELALHAYAAALKVVTRQQAPQHWAMAINNVGNALAERIRGNQADNVEGALAAFQAAIQVYIPAIFPNEWASMQHNLGNAYLQRIQGDRASNVEAGLQCLLDALQVRTAPDQQIDRSSTLNNLGDAYLERHYGKRADNVEAALLALHQALQIRDRRIYPLLWATTQTNLGNAYRARLRGDAADNLEQAIAAFQAALEVNTPDRSPPTWATTQNNLGIALQERLRGERAENQEAAITTFQQVLQVRTVAADPTSWAKTHINLGNAFMDRIRGDRADNVEAALSVYQIAASRLTRTAFPMWWATALNDLGNAYRVRIIGQSSDNVEMAISAFRQALLVYTRTDFPREWAMTTSNLGNAYHERIYGEEGMNQEAAIATYQEAVQVYTRQAYPADWAMLQNNLGSAYLTRSGGSRADNLEAALQTFLAGGQIFTRNAYPADWARIQNNVATTYAQRLVGDPQSNREAALAAYRAALTVRTPDAFPLAHRDTCLNVAKMALEGLLAENEPRALLLAHAAFARARAVQSELTWIAATPQGKAFARGTFTAVRAMYAQAAWVLWRLRRPRAAVVALEEGRAHALAESVTLAGADTTAICQDHAPAFAAARLTLQTAIAQGDAPASRTARTVFRALRATLRACTACSVPDFLPDTPSYAALCRGAADRPIIYLSATKYGCLVLVVPPDGGAPRSVEIAPVTTEHIARWLTRRDAAGNITGGFWFALRPQASELLNQWVVTAADDATIRQRLSTSLPALAAMIDGSFTTLRQSMIAMITVWQKEADYFANQGTTYQEDAQRSRERLTMPLGDLLDHPEHGAVLRRDLTWFLKHHEIMATLETVGSQLMQPVRNWLTDQGWDDPDQPLALIPVGQLSLFPLHAAPVRDTRIGQQIPFQETCLLTYQASTQSLAAARESGERMPPVGDIFCLANPQPTADVALAWAELEGQILSTLAAQVGKLAHPPLLGEDARLSAFLAALEVIQRDHAGALVTLATHGYTNPVAPDQSYLLLANDRRLTLATLQRGRLFAGLREVSAEGCATGVGDSERAPDEILHLAGGILQAGAAAALVTQWTVSDRATFLLMLARMRFLLGDPPLSPVKALRNAAKWLRCATWNDLQTLADSSPDAIKPFADEDYWTHDSLRGALSPAAFDQERSADADLFATLAQPTLRQFFMQHTLTHPYAHPFYWAAFVAFGW